MAYQAHRASRTCLVLLLAGTLALAAMERGPRADPAVPPPDLVLEPFALPPAAPGHARMAPGPPPAQAEGFPLLEPLAGRGEADGAQAVEQAGQAAAAAEVRVEEPGEVMDADPLFAAFLLNGEDLLASVAEAQRFGAGQAEGLPEACNHLRLRMGLLRGLLHENPGPLPAGAQQPVLDAAQDLAEALLRVQGLLGAPHPVPDPGAVALPPGEA